MSWSWEQEDSSHAHWVYIDKDGKVLYDFFSLADEHAEFHDHDDSTDWTGKRVPHPYAVGFSQQHRTFLNKANVLRWQSFFK